VVKASQSREEQDKGDKEDLMWFRLSFDGAVINSGGWSWVVDQEGADGKGACVVIVSTAGASKRGEGENRQVVKERI
jgi:hypothetical protein